MELRRKSLFLFVEIFPVYSSSHGNGNGNGGAKPEDFRDGMIITRILKENVDPLHFSDLVASSRNPYTELNKITAAMKKYCSEKKRGHFIPFYLMPNIEKIVSTDETKDICRLLQLLLVCAVNCPRNGDYLTKINKMEPQVRTELKGAIDELMISKAAFEGLLQKAWSDKSRLNKELEKFKEMYSELQNELSLVTEKKDEEISEKLRVISVLQSQIDSLIIKNQSKAEMRQPASTSESTGTCGPRELELESQVQTLEEKVQELEKKNGWLHAQIGPKDPESEHYLRKDLSEMAQQLAKAHHRVTEVESVLLFHDKWQQKHESTILQVARLKEENERLKKNLQELQQRQIDNARQQSDQNALITSVASKFMPSTSFLRNGWQRLSYQQPRRPAANLQNQPPSSPRAVMGDEKPESDQNFEYFL